MVSDSRSVGKSIVAWRLQIRGLCCRYRQPDCRTALLATCHSSAAWHFLLHFYANRLPRGCLCRELRDYSALRYTLFVTYFPHLVGGPIIHHKPVLAQLADPKIARLRTINWVIGLIFFSIGLAKKLLIADPLGEIASPIFGAILQPGVSLRVTATTFNMISREPAVSSPHLHRVN